MDLLATLTTGNVIIRINNISAQFINAFSMNPFIIEPVDYYYYWLIVFQYFHSGISDQTSQRVQSQIAESRSGDFYPPSHGLFFKNLKQDSLDDYLLFLCFFYFLTNHV